LGAQSLREYHRKPMTQPPTAEAAVALARHLIAAPSPNPPGDERACAAAVDEALEEFGLPAATRIARSELRPNLLTTIDFGPGGRHLCLAGHLDTKPVGDASWTTDPFEGAVAGDRLYGLGSADMKGAVAAMLVAAARIAADSPPLGRLSLLFTADEEDGGAWGAHHLARSGAIACDGIVLGEPGGLHTDFDSLHLVSRGIARFHVDVGGDQGHASLSDQSGAVNASVELGRLLVAFAERFTPRQPPRGHPIRGWHTTVTAGLRLGGGVGYGVVPGQASFSAEVRLLPGMTRSELEEQITEFVAGEARLNPRLRARLRFDVPPSDFLPATEVATVNPLAVAARAVCREILGRVPDDSVFPGTTDAAHLHGLAGIPTLPAFGPGLIAVTHGADEWVSVEALRSSVHLYEALVRTYCAEVGPRRPALTPDFLT